MIRTKDAKDELFDFMIANTVYPFCSNNGKVFLRCATKGLLTKEKTKEIIECLNLQTKSDCDVLREKIKAEAKKRRPNRSIKEWVEEERPREMLLQKGAENLSLAKLLAIILRTGKEGLSAEELAKNLLNRFGSLRAIDAAPVSELSAIEGMGPAKAVQIKAALELGKRLSREKALLTKRLSRPDEVIAYVAEYYAPYLRDKEKEVFSIILLDIKNKPIENIAISAGSVNASIVDPKEIVRAASLKSASAVILIHNHPSGETVPSKEDIELTKRIEEACALIGVNVLDHIIIGKNVEDFYSFARAGLLK